MKVWIVEDGDYDSTYIVAVYPSLEMAVLHTDRMGGSHSEHDVLDALHPDATEQRRLEREQEAATERERAADWAWRPKTSSDVLGLPEAPPGMTATGPVRWAVKLARKP